MAELTRPRRVLTVNAGSSSLKVRLLGPDDAVLARADLPARAGEFDPAALAGALREAGAVHAVGHRIVHGGRDFHGPVRLDAAVERRLADLTPLAPLHQPAGLAGVAAVREILPDTVQVACFDTAFHSGLPEVAATYAVPARWREEYGLRRYGFHGLSHAYAAYRTGQLLGGAVPRLVVCHLGAGASLAAVRDGRSVDTTMGFTPLEGLVMATRSGSVDPGMLLWLQTRAGLDAAQVNDALEHRSGLAGLAGTGDMREVLGRAARGEPAAVLARDVYVYRLRAHVAAMAAALGGLDAVAFTGGVGENAPEIRARTAEGLAFLGVALDAERNEAADGDTEIGAEGAAVRTVVVDAREDVRIAAEVRQVLAGRA